MKRKRLAMIERFHNIDVCAVTRNHVVDGIVKRRTTTHYNVTPTSYTRLRMAILTMVARGDGHIDIMELPPTPAYGWIYRSHA